MFYCITVHSCKLFSLLFFDQRPILPSAGTDLAFRDIKTALAVRGPFLPFTGMDLPLIGKTLANAIIPQGYKFRLSRQAARILKSTRNCRALFLVLP
jgi:hypothetical protein